MNGALLVSRVMRTTFVAHLGEPSAATARDTRDRVLALHVAVVSILLLHGRSVPRRADARRCGR